MKDDYLWDGSGEPDEEIKQLEDLLGGLKHQPQAIKPVMPASLQIMPTPVKPRFWQRTELKIAVAASILLMLTGAIWFMWAGQAAKPGIVNNQKPAIPATTDKINNNEMVITTPKPNVPKVENKGQESTSQEPNVEISNHKSTNNIGIEISHNNRPRVKKINPAVYKTKVQSDDLMAQEASTQLLSALQIASGKLRGAIVKAKLTESPESYNFRQNKLGEDL